MRPLSLIVFAACLATIVISLFSGSVSPLVSGGIYLLSAALIVVDFNVLAQARDRGGRDLARHRDLRLDREHLRVAPQYLLRR